MSARPIQAGANALHLTVAAVVERDGKFLLVEERIGERLVLNQPAGHVEAGESLLEAVRRETAEETAWRFTPQALIGIYQWTLPGTGHTYLRHAFCGTVAEHDPAAVLDDPVVRSLWLGRDELQARADQLRSPLVLACIDDYLAGRRFPLDLFRRVPEQGNNGRSRFSPTTETDS